MNETRETIYLPNPCVICGKLIDPTIAGWVEHWNDRPMHPECYFHDGVVDGKIL